MLKKLKNGVVGNMILNIIAGAVSVCSLQLIILPYLGRVMEETTYGLVVTLLSILNIIPATFGNSLNNIRLLYRKDYEQNNIVGDFNVILVIEALITLIVTIPLTFFYIEKSSISENVILHILLIGLLSIFWIIREYFIVAFLLELQYKNILINNCLLALGYFLGLFLFNFINYWEIIYITGYILSLIYIFFKTDLWKEKLNTTVLFPTVIKENFIYIAASLLYRLTAYADKMLLYPILGGIEISVYYVATLSSKVISLLITPISGVMLSYLSKIKKSDAKKTFTSVFIIGGSVCIIGYFLCLFLSQPLLSVLYPQYRDRAMEYVPVTTATIVISVFISLINPFILRYLVMKWQVLINLITLIIYVFGTLTLLKFYGLRGFCIGCLIANIVKLLVMLQVYRTAKKRNE
jgi:O-antigen/teichoic acid export membrane protein